MGRIDLPLRLSAGCMRRLRIERLEVRHLMDAAGVSAVNDNFSTTQNGPAQLLEVLSNDQFDDDYAGDRVITSVSYGSQGGIVEIAEQGDTIRYLPPPDFRGLETFVYWVDGVASGTVQMSVSSPLSRDRFDLFLVPGETITLDVLGNDDFGDDYTGAREITTASGSDRFGKIAIADDGKSLVYTYDASLGNRSESITYLVDGQYSQDVAL